MCGNSEFFFHPDGVLDMDFSKLEERIIEGDLHRRKAAEMSSVPYESVTPEQRTAAKRINYLDAYGIPNHPCAS
jgi:DNA polymerase I-like protein with 3'-5' exonuclease and polymerase domains